MSENLPADPTRASAGARLGGRLLRSMAHRPGGQREQLPAEGHLPAFDRATGWLNCEPLSRASLRGRVVLVDFWTYTCVNWLRTLPYLVAWDARYRDAGLSIVGVHTPEFGFEHDHRNVVAQLGSLGVRYPIAVDDDYGVWDAFANHYWPAVYIADTEGRIRYHHFGEGEYARIEMVIQQLLQDAGADFGDRGLVRVDPRGLEVAADWGSLRSPETYLGYAQSSGFAAEDPAFYDRPHTYAASPGLALNTWGLTGRWTVGPHAAVLDEAGGQLSYAFHARDVNLVMRPARDGATVRFRVSLDGLPAGVAAGTDVDADGRGIAVDPRTYQLVRQRAPIADHVVEIEFLDPGIEAYCVTFG